MILRGNGPYPLGHSLYVPFYLLCVDGYSHPYSFPDRRSEGSSPYVTRLAVLSYLVLGTGPTKTDIEPMDVTIRCHCIELLLTSS